MTIFLPPWPQVIDPATNFPISGGRLFFFLSGTTTAVDVYSDSTLSTSLGNEIECDAYGRPETAIYLDPAKSYKVIVTNSDGNTGSPLYPVIDPYDPNGKAEAQFSAVSGAADTIEAADRGKIIRRSHSAAMSDTLPTAASVGNGFFVTIRNTTSAYNITVSVASAGTIDGASTLIVYPGQDRVLRSNGTTWYADPAPRYLGYESIPLPAAGWKEAETNGCTAIARVESAVQLINYDHLAFSNSADQLAYLITGLPASYLPGSLQFRVWWQGAGGTAADTVRWGLAGRCYGDDDTIDAAYGSPAYVSDAFTASTKFQRTAWTSITPGNDTADSLLALRLVRDTVTDNLAAAARLVMVELRFIPCKPTDA